MNVIKRLMLKLALKGTDLSLTSTDGWPDARPTWAGVPVNNETQFQLHTFDL